MTITVRAIFKEGQLQSLSPSSQPEDDLIQAAFVCGTPDVMNPNSRSIEERVAGIEALSAHYRTLDIPHLPDEAFERASWYADDDGPNTKFELYQDREKRASNDFTA